MRSLLGLLYVPTALAQIFVGTAYDLDGKVLYREEHEIFGQRDRLVSRYLQSNNPLPRCTMTSDFSNPYLPNTSFKDEVTGKEFVLEADDNHLTIAFRPSFQSESRENSMVFQGQTIAGQGLHFWIVDNLDKLADGKRLSFDYVIASKAKKLSMQAAAKSLSDERIKITMEPKSMFVRWFLDPIELIYDKEGRIQEYKGPSNVWLDGEGNPVSVRIEYHYLAANQT